jgi:hypothetical protein
MHLSDPFSFAEPLLTTGLVIIGEIAFFLSMVLLGKEFLLKIKNFWVKLNIFQKQQD